MNNNYPQAETKAFQYLQHCCLGLGAHKVFVTLIRLAGTGGRVFDRDSGDNSRAALDSHARVMSNKYSRMLLQRARKLGIALMATGNMVVQVI
jgi:hypothetical protein